MGCRKNFRILLKIVISLACLTVCSYQVYIVGVLYLSYPTTIDLRIGRSLNVHLPGLTICMQNTVFTVESNLYTMFLKIGTEISTTILAEKIVEIQPSLFHILHGMNP